MSKPKACMPRSLVETIRIAVDEMFEALEESIAGLTTEQVWANPVEKRHSAGVLIMHLHHNIDRHACHGQVGHWALEHEDRLMIFGKPVEDFMHLDNPPDVEVLRERTAVLKRAVLATLDDVDDETLYTPRYAENTFWWQEHKRVSIDGYHRVVWHANAHIRQIWCVRGAMNAFDREHFPRQFRH